MSDGQEPLSEQLKRLYQADRVADGLDLLADLHPADVADVLEHLPEEEQAAYLKGLEPESRAEVLVEMEEAHRLQSLESLPPADLVTLMPHLDSDDAADVLADLSSEQAASVLEQIDRADEMKVRRLLTYPEDTAGGLMQTELVRVDQEASIDRVLQMVREQAREVDDFSNIFVLSQDRQLVGVLSLPDLLAADPDKPVGEVMSPVTVAIRPEEDQEEVALLFQKYDLLSAPVVDSGGRLVGRVTIDDVVDVIQEEASEDIYRMAGTDDEELAYGERVFKISRLRLPWILVNLFGGMFTGYLLWLFKLTLAEVLVLVTFVPVTTAMAGNVGIQTSTIFVRSMALGSYSAAHLDRVLFRELKVAIIMGLTCGLVAGAAAFLWHSRPALGLVVGLAMLLNILLAAFIGVLAPAFFRRIKVDPALASGPLVTTVNDITGILVYLGVATLCLKYLIE